MQRDDVQASLQRLTAHQGVLGYMVVAADGTALQSTCNAATTALHAAAATKLAAAARMLVREIDPQNDLEYMRIRSSKHELMVAPYDNLTLIAVQAVPAAT